jgi:Fe-S cluster assembly protein SufD
VLIHHLTDGKDVASFPRHFVRVEEGGEVDVVVWSSSTKNSSGMYNGILEASIAPNARLMLEKVCNEDGEIYHFSHENIIQERDSKFKMHTFTVKGHWVRNELEIISRGKGTDSIFNGAFLPTGNEHVDNHTTMDHTSTDGTSSELYRGIMYGTSTGVFNGKVFVRPDAQRTNAFQQNTNIVADRGASINAKPELEIYADDVKCSHGCTVGQFDLDALFYLKSRGIDEKAAKALLVEAFLADVISNVPSAELREEIMKIYKERHGW